MPIFIHYRLFATYNLIENCVVATHAKFKNGSWQVISQKSDIRGALGKWLKIKHRIPKQVAPFVILFFDSLVLGALGAKLRYGGCD